MPKRMTEQQWRDLSDLQAHWSAFTQSDAFDGSDTFAERMAASGYARLRQVTRCDLNEPFAAELGIEKGGHVWVLTSKGREALETVNT